MGFSDEQISLAAAPTWSPGCEEELERVTRGTKDDVGVFKLCLLRNSPLHLTRQTELYGVSVHIFCGKMIHSLP